MHPFESHFVHAYGVRFIVSRNQEPIAFHTLLLSHDTLQVFRICQELKNVWPSSLNDIMLTEKNVM